MKKFTQTILVALCMLIGFSANAQDTEYKFSEVYNVKTTSVKNQQSTGTCWCYATISFIETELLRTMNKEYDLSEMFVTRNAFLEKGKRYFRFHGKTNFSEGGQAHDVLQMMDKYGICTEQAYLGLNYGSTYHIHSEMVAELKGILDGLNKNKNKKISTAWERAFNGFINSYMGEPVKTFKADKKEVTPKEFYKSLKFNSDDYVEIMSYSCYPFYEKSELEIPDNWTHSRYYNLPIDDLMEIMNNALKNNYSFAWDGDVSEKGFSHRNALAILPTSHKENMVNSEMSKWDDISAKDIKKKMFKQPVPEAKVDDALRLKKFDSRETTDDHLMHITALHKDQNGTKYYLVKNSWASDSNKFGGYLRMSESYARLHTVAIMVHKDALPKKIAKKLGLR
ncbi:MAG: C1 family peptidase [Marinifilaceae bacterium]